MSFEPAVHVTCHYVPRSNNQDGFYSKSGVLPHCTVVVATKRYGIFTYMYHKNQPKVGKHTIMIWPTARVSTTPGCFRSEFPLLCQPGCTQLPFALHLWQFFSLVKVSIKRDSLGEYFQHHTHTIHGTGIFSYMCHKHQPNVGKYTSPADGRGYIFQHENISCRSIFVC